MRDLGFIYDYWNGEPGVVDITQPGIRSDLRFSPSDEQSAVVTLELDPDTSPLLPSAISGSTKPDLLWALNKWPPLSSIPTTLVQGWKAQQPELASYIQSALSSPNAPFGADNFTFNITNIPNARVRARAVSVPQMGNMLLLDLWLPGLSLDVTVEALAGYPWTPDTPSVELGDIGGGLSVGTYQYAVTALDGFGGETGTSAVSSITIKDNRRQVALTWPAAGNAFGGYNVYRSKANQGGNALYLAGTVLPTDNAIVDGVPNSAPGWNVPQPDAIIPYTDSRPDSDLQTDTVVSTTQAYVSGFVYEPGGIFTYVPQLLSSTPFKYAPVVAPEAGQVNKLRQGKYRYAVTAVIGEESGASPFAVINLPAGWHKTYLTWDRIPDAQGGYNIYRSLKDQGGNAVYLAGHVAQPEDGYFVTYVDNVPDRGLNQEVVPPTGPRLPTGYGEPPVPWPLTSLTFSASVDLEFYLVAHLDGWPNAPVVVGSGLYNPSIQPTGWTHVLSDLADIARALEGFFLLVGQGLASFFGQGASVNTTPFQNPLDNAGSQVTGFSVPASLDPVASKLAEVQQYAASFGFFQCTASTDTESATPLTLTMIHPLDPPPVAYDLQASAAPGQPRFQQVFIAAAQSQATPGGQLTVTGVGFPSLYQMGIGWTDTCSGTVTGSDVEWGPVGQAATITHLPATAYFQFQPFARVPGQPLLIGGGGAQPGPYVFRVRNSDTITTTPFSDPITVWSYGTLDLILSYQSSSPAKPRPLKPQTGAPGGPTPPPPPGLNVVVGTPAVLSDGTFLVSIIIPPDALPGPATLCAQLGGQTVKCLQITIVTQIKPLLRLVNPGSLIDVGTEVQPGYPTWVAGEGFAPDNSDVSIYIDQELGLPEYFQGAAVAGAQGTFLHNFPWPSIAQGDHTLIAKQVTATGQTVQATLSVTEFIPPPLQ